MKNQEYIWHYKYPKHLSANLLLSSVLIWTALWIVLNQYSAYNSLAYVAGSALLITGIAGVISSVQYRKVLRGWELALAAGFLDLFMGMELILNSGMAVSNLMIILGAIFSYHSVKIIIWSIELKKYEARNWSLLFLGSILGVMLSFKYLLEGTITIFSLLFFTSFALLVVGIFEIYYSSVTNRLTQ